MGTLKSQPVNIIVNLDWPESLTEEELCSFVEHWLMEHRLIAGRVRSVRKLSDSEELAKSTTASVTENTESCVCSLPGLRDCPIRGHGGY